MDKDSSEKYICYECIGEDYLKREIENNFLVVNCSYCENEDIEGILLTELAHKIDIAFEQHYKRSSEYPPDHWSIEHIKSIDYWEPDGTPIVQAIMDAAEVDEEIAEDVQHVLAEMYYDHSAAKMGEYSDYHDDAYYDTKDADDENWQRKWTKFEDSLKTSARFFSKESELLLKSIFTDIEILSTRDNRPIVRYIGPEDDIKSLYRARAFQSDNKLKLALESPEKELGPPPSEHAIGGRMNARGISVFYGAVNSKIALAEIRPPVGSKVIVARFQIERQLKVLDLSALTYTTAIGSIFDEDYSELLSKSMFLRKLSQRMTKAIMPDDEHSEYLATQVIADFLSSEFEFDGIIFPSAQFKEGLNITLFHQACRVNIPKYEEGTEIEATLTNWDGDDEIPEYKIVKSFPNVEKVSEVSKKTEKWNFPGIEMKMKDPDQRKSTLLLELDSITVEHIKSVEINSKSYSVGSLEYTKSSGGLESDILDY